VSSYNLFSFLRGRKQITCSLFEQSQFLAVKRPVVSRGICFGTILGSMQTHTRLF